MSELISMVVVAGFFAIALCFGFAIDRVCKLLENIRDELERSNEIQEHIERHGR